MTPLAQKLFRRGVDSLSAKSPMLVMLATASHFDLSPVLPVILETMESLSAQMPVKDALYDHGGLLFEPDVNYWLEFHERGAPRYGALVQRVEDELGYTFFFPCEYTSAREPYEVMWGFLRLVEDDTFSVHLDLRDGRRSDAKDAKTNIQLGMMLASATMLINAPRGVKRVEGEIHKSIARILKRLGVGPLKKPHLIMLDELAGPVSGEVGHGGRKSFHYSRAHLRHLAYGKVVRVRGCWKGDPALGTSQPSYRVRSASVPRKQAA